MAPKQPPPPPLNENIRGEPLDLDTLLNFAQIDAVDIESAAEWWDNGASAEWIGALDSEPVEGE